MADGHTFPHQTDTMILAHDDSRCGRDGAKRNLRWQSIVVRLLRLVQQMPGVQHRVIALHNHQQQCMSGQRNTDLHDNVNPILSQNAGRKLGAAVCLALIPRVRREEGDGGRAACT